MDMEICSVCSQLIEEADSLITKCLHHFHKKCVSTNSADMFQCPQCSGEMGADLVKGDCSICMEPLKNSTYITDCRHSFHHNCILKWTTQNESCPICRRTVPKENILKESNYDLSSDTDDIAEHDSTSYDIAADELSDRDEFFDSISTYWSMFMS